jgi:hypothetical protein
MSKGTVIQHSDPATQKALVRPGPNKQHCKIRPPINWTGNLNVTSFLYGNTRRT